MTMNDNVASLARGNPPYYFRNGRTFRSFKELNIAASGSYVVKIVLPVPVYFTGFDINIESGQLKVETVSAGTPGGTFAETLPVIKTNLTAPTDYVVQTALTAGGTHTGGTVIDVVRLKTNNNLNQGTSVIIPDQGIRGIAAGTYHWRFTNLSTTDAVTGTVKIMWTEPF